MVPFDRNRVLPLDALVHIVCWRSTKSESNSFFTSFNSFTKFFTVVTTMVIFCLIFDWLTESYDYLMTL